MYTAAGAKKMPNETTDRFGRETVLCVGRKNTDLGSGTPDFEFNITFGSCGALNKSFGFSESPFPDVESESDNNLS